MKIWCEMCEGIGQIGPSDNLTDCRACGGVGYKDHSANLRLTDKDRHIWTCSKCGSETTLYDKEPEMFKFCVGCGAEFVEVTHGN